MSLLALEKHKYIERPLVAAILAISLLGLSACGDESESTDTQLNTESGSGEQTDSTDTENTDSDINDSTDAITEDSGDGNFSRGSLGDNDDVPDYSCDTIVSSISALESAVSETMSAGTTLCLADGNYTNLALSFGGTGTASDPIVVAAENPGNVVIGGEVGVRMGGEYVYLQGFIFKDGNSDSDLLQTRLGSNPSEYCYHCRISEIAVINFDEDADDSTKWIHIYGNNNRVDHSYFSGKSNAGALLVVNRELGDYVTTADEAYGNYITIDHNYFGDRPPADGKAYADSSDNEYEAVRIGTSDAHTSNSNSVVEYNFFEKIQGEAEVISNKSGNNTIRYNTIRDSYGSLTTRHGSSATIAGNVIIGDDHPYAGGLRIVDDGHSVYNNYIEGARYLDTTHHGGIVLMGSDGSTTNGYQQLENVMVANNTIIDSVNSLNVDGGNKSSNPESVYLVNNLIQDAIGAVITQSDDGMPVNSTIEGNIFYGQSYADSDSVILVQGISWLDAELETDSLGIDRPTEATSADLQVDAYQNDDFDSITTDMDGQVRGTTTTLAGADELIESTTTLGLLNRYDVGPINYTPAATDAHVQQVSISNHDFDDGSESWTLDSGASISTDSEHVFSRGSSAYIETAGSKVSQQVTLAADTNYTLTAFATGIATLGAELEGVSYETSINESDYDLVSVSFNSASATSATVYGMMSTSVETTAALVDGDFSDFYSDAGTSEDWVIIESDSQDATIGTVNASSNSASGDDGSLRFKYSSTSEVGEPEVKQLISDLPANTDFTLAIYVLEKNDSALSLTWGAYAGDSDQVLYSEEIDIQTLKNSDAEEGDDSFLKTELSFNNGSNTELTVFVRYNAHTLLADGTLTDVTNTEVRIDDVSLTYQGEPSGGDVAIFDSFRLVSHESLE
ncbi:polysaccharide lyase 6 family protein [Reinekea marinisedimentorum]|uniref:Poly(Beta-D-mannuronate) lyase n=1 Tax=Reinekea marinisedimentorum TaxID=230495 RepID=A0A4R3I8J2_9GAMM|nr:polysaccharide lyase 6 family protein [Reinekea marinisedimentorum]TCS41619.1 poly(beta-D-mannuronate) lyase [Reinekea marinisedimentorum]